MKKFLHAFALVLAFGLGSLLQTTEASHVMGSDIVYRCLGNGRYEVTVRVYRDCNGIQLSQSNVIARCSSSTITISNQNKISQRDITGIDARCPTGSRCVSGGFQYGVEEHIWRMTLDLSNSQCCEWTLSWEQCCRNGNISTGQANQNFYTTANLNKCVTPCNSSPDFTNPPVAIICVNQDFVFNNGALDTNDQGDSLSYSLVAGMQNANSQVTYSGSFSPVRPLTFWGFPNNSLTFPLGFTLDPTTGDLLFRPTSVNQVAIVVIEVKEWRKINGIMEVVGRTRRDMQVIVVSCPGNKVPKIKPPFSAQACAGQQVCLKIETEDDDTDDTVRISWNRGIPGASFTNNNGAVKLASGEVCWTPNANQVSNIPYTFTVTAKDDACPLAGQAVRAFSIFVRETPESDLVLKNLTCGFVAINHTLKKNYGTVATSWEIRDTLNRVVFRSTEAKDTAFLQPGVHPVRLQLRTTTPCINLYYDTIVVPPFVQIDIPRDTFVCSGEQMMILSSTKGGNSPYEYEWKQIGDTTSSVLATSANFSPTPDSTVSYVIQVKDSNNCRNWDTIDVNYVVKPPVFVGPDQRVCLNISVDLNAGYDSLTALYSYLWSNNDTTWQTSVKEDANHWVKVTDSMGCYSLDTMKLNVNDPKPDAGSTRIRCFGDTVSLTATEADQYWWYNLAGFSFNPLPTPLSTSATYSFNVTQTADYIVRGRQTFMGVTCEAYDTVRVNMNPLPVIEFDPKGPHCPEVTSVPLISYLKFPTLTGGTWRSNVNSNFVVSNNFNPNLAGPNPTVGHPVVYRVTDNNGCTSEGTTNVRVYNPAPVSLRDTFSVCGDIGEFKLNNLRILPVSIVGFQPVWSSGNNNPLVNNNILTSGGHTASDPALNINNLTQNVIYPIVLRITQNTTQCVGYDTSLLRVKTVPNTNAGTINPLCWNDPTINLNTSSGASPAGGVWSSSLPIVGGGSSFNPSSIGTNLRYTGGQGRFYYTVTVEGCPKRDSLDLTIKPIPDVKILPDSFCIDAPNHSILDNVNLKGGGAAFEGVGVSGTSFSPISSGSGSFQIKYTFTNNLQCKNSDSTIFYVQPLPQLSVTSPSAACAGEVFNVEARTQNIRGLQWTRTGDGTFTGGNATTTDSFSVYTPGSQDISNGSFSLRVRTTNSPVCPEDEENFTVGIYPIPTAEIVADPMEGCDPLDVNFQAVTDAGQGVFLSWNYGDGNTENGRDELRTTDHTFNGPGAYTVNLTVHSDSSFGYCRRDAQPVQITVFPTPTADLDADKWFTTTAAPGVQFFDKSTIGGGGTINKWDWSFGDPAGGTSTERNPFYDYPISKTSDTGIFLVTLRVETPDGCWDEATRPFELRPDITVFIPNAFTPNDYGPGRNNRFFAVPDGHKTFEMTIFNRWGEILYYSTNENDGWDGNYKGEPAMQDVYVYLVRVTSFAGKAYEYYGTITLLR
jgi:gliding motility-associated-like protein